MQFVKGAVAEMLNASAEVFPPFENTVRSFLAATFQNFTSFRNEQLHLMALPRILQPDSQCIDIGAHNGKFLHHILRFAPNGTHIAFEPLPGQFGRLLRQYSDDERVILHNMALSNVSGIQPFIFVRNAPGISSFKVHEDSDSLSTETIQVPVFKLDEVLTSNRKVDYIKLDVEGAELLVFEGAINTLSRHKPFIIFEHHIAAFKPYGDTSQGIWNLLHNQLGYKIASIQEWLLHRPALTKEEFLAEVELGKVVDFLAYHPDSGTMNGTATEFA